MNYSRNKPTDVHDYAVTFRFAGPATTVSVFCSSHPPLATPDARREGVRTEGQAVAETAHRFTYCLVLHPDQLNLLNNPPREAFITGPPGEW